MGSEVVPLIMIPILFFVLLNFILQSEVSGNYTHEISRITCQWPDYNNGWNTTSILDASTCSNTTHPSSYSNDVFVIWNATGAWYSGGADWVATVPNGWIVYPSHIFTSFFERVVSLFVLVILPLAIPAVISNLQFMWAINVPLYIMMGFGIYRGVNPFG